MNVLIASLWQGLAIAAVTALALRFARGLNAATRYVIWWLACLTVIALPAAHLLLRSRSATSSLAGATPTGFGPIAIPPPPDWLIACVAGAWLGTVLLGVGRIVRGVQLLVHLKRCARPLSLELEQALTLWRSERNRGRKADLRVSTEVAGACALGLAGRPVIALSDQLVSALDVDALDQIIMHEQAHLSRYDDWMRLLQSGITALLGLHPAVRIIARALDLERESACDDVVVARCGAPARYAACLAEAADAAAARQRPAHAIVPYATGNGLLFTRVQRLLDPGVSRQTQVRAAAIAVAAAAFVGAAAVGPAAPVITVGAIEAVEARATLPLVQGVPDADTFGRRVEDETPPSIAGGSGRPSRPSPRGDRGTTMHAPAPEVLPALSEDAEPATSAPDGISPILLDSTTDTTPLPSSAFSMPQKPPDADGKGGWASLGNAGTALGQRLGRMGTASGTASRRGGVAIGGFFSRAGKAVADSF